LARALITGMGCVTPLGGSVAALEPGLFGGECGLAPIRRFPTDGLRSDLGGEIATPPPLPPWADPDRVSLSRELGFLAAAVQEATADAGLASQLRGSRVGCVASTNFAGSGAMERVHASDPPSAEAFGAMLFDAGPRMLADCLGLRGPSVALSISCASGTSAVGLAAQWVRRGLVDVALAVGYDALTLYVLAGLSILRTTSTDTCRPFDRNRSGTVFSEGAAAVIIESDAHAAGRGALAHAEILGYADTNNAYHLTAPDKDGEGIRLAIERAIGAAGIAPSEVDYVNAHGTGTVYHDVTEVRALKSVLGDRAREIPVTSIKGAVGHLMGAAGTVEVIAGILAIRRGEAPPTVGLAEPDPECDLDHVPDGPRPFAIRSVLTNSAGIGASNASLVLRAAG
jgi:3-oxoacyl-(acyl-carrier-protein) synthase